MQPKIPTLFLHLFSDIIYKFKETHSATHGNVFAPSVKPPWAAQCLKVLQWHRECLMLIQTNVEPCSCHMRTTPVTEGSKRWIMKINAPDIAGSALNFFYFLYFVFQWNKSAIRNGRQTTPQATQYCSRPSIICIVACCRDHGKYRRKHDRCL